MTWSSNFLLDIACNVQIIITWESNVFKVVLSRVIIYILVVTIGVCYSQIYDLLSLGVHSIGRSNSNETNANWNSIMLLQTTCLRLETLKISWNYNLSDHLAWRIFRHTRYTYHKKSSQPVCSNWILNCGLA